VYTQVEPSTASQLDFKVVLPVETLGGWSRCVDTPLNGSPELMVIDEQSNFKKALDEVAAKHLTEG
jgi:hypothetical protein